MQHANLSVPFACTESWDAMSPVHQGRHCSTCQTTVYDFANMSDAELVSFFENYKGNHLCGRVACVQSKVLEKSRKTARRSFSLRAVFVGLSLIAGLSVEMRAGNIDPSQFENPIQMGSNPINNEPILSYGLTGRVLTKNVEFNATTLDLYVKNEKKLSITVHLDGKFHAQIPTTYYEQGFYLKATHKKKSKRSKIYKMEDVGKEILISFK